jgi:hypothetical protein
MAAGYGVVHGGLVPAASFVECVDLALIWAGKWYLNICCCHINGSIAR